MSEKNTVVEDKGTPEQFDPGAPVESSSINIRRTYKESGVTMNESQDEDIITVRVPPKGVPLGRARAAARMTVNMGNYETVQLEVSIELPCVPEEINECYRYCKELVDSHLNKEIRDIRAYRDSKSTSTGT